MGYFNCEECNRCKIWDGRRTTCLEECMKPLNALEEYKEYKRLEEQGLLLRLDSKDELIEVLASKLLNEQFGACYMCKNPMKNITLDGVHNGCDGECNLSEEHTVDDFIKKIVGELERNKQSRH